MVLGARCCLNTVCNNIPALERESHSFNLQLANRLEASENGNWYV